MLFECVPLTALIRIKNELSDSIQWKSNNSVRFKIVILMLQKLPWLHSKRTEAAESEKAKKKNIIRQNRTLYKRFVCNASAKKYAIYRLKLIVKHVFLFTLRSHCVLCVFIVYGFRKIDRRSEYELNFVMHRKTTPFRTSDD